MNINLLRNIDELFGPPVCLVLHLYNGVRRRLVKPVLNPVNRILLLKFLGMGSIIMMAPMVRALRRRYPRAKITMFTFASNREICELTGLFDDIVTVDSGSLGRIFRSILGGIWRLRRRRFDVCIDLEFFSKFSTIVAFLTGSRVRVGYFLIQLGVLIKMMWRGNLLTHQVFYNQHKHVTACFLELARAIGADTDDHRYATLTVPPPAAARVAELLGPFREPGDRVVAVNINASALSLERRWPAAHYADLVARVAATSPRLKIVLIGAPEDAAYVGAFVMGLNGPLSAGRVCDLSGRLSVSELCALLAEVDLLITNDSGPLHLAVALGRPTVSFFGPETPQRFGPAGDQHLVLHRQDLYCSPCLNVYNQKRALCRGNNICLKELAPDVVYAAMRDKHGALFRHD